MRESRVSSCQASAASGPASIRPATVQTASLTIDGVLGDVDCADGCRQRAATCTAQALAQLGPLLCLFPAVDHNPLSGWGRARRTLHGVGIDSDGPRETLLFLDADEQVCWQLCLLPDTDFLRWDRLVNALPKDAANRLRGRRNLTHVAVARGVGEPLWRACPLRLHAVSAQRDAGRLAAACVTLSEAGRREAARLAARALPGEPPPATAAALPSIASRFQLDAVSR